MALVRYVWFIDRAEAGDRDCAYQPLSFGIAKTSFAQAFALIQQTGFYNISAALSILINRVQKSFFLLFFLIFT